MKKTSLIIFAVLVSLLAGGSASANVPLGAAAFLAYPTISYFNSSIVALIIVVILESLIFYQITKYELYKSFVLVLIANVISSIIGIVLVFSFSDSILFFIMLFPIALIFSKMLKYICTTTNMFRISAKVSLIIFIAIEIVSFILCILLIPMTDKYASRNLIAPNYYITVIFMFSLIVVGFILTIVAETYTVVKYYASKGIATDKSVVRAVLMMNIISYVVLSVLYGQTVVQNILKH